MINAYQANRASLKKSWSFLTNLVEQDVMEAIKSGVCSCRVRIPNTNIRLFARLIKMLLQNMYSVNVKPFMNKSWILDISWDEPGARVVRKITGQSAALLYIQDGVEKESGRVQALKSALLNEGIANGDENA